MNWLTHTIEFIFNLNTHLANLVSDIGLWSYVVLFAIIFSETGLIIMPFLPGDSLLFAAGSICAMSELNVHILVMILIIAAFLGNTLNYLVGLWFGHRLFNNPRSKIFNHKHLEKAHVFYEKYGAYAVFMSRFLPLLRTFIPFIAGMAEMSRLKFMLFTFLGAIAWVVFFVYGGYFFGTLPAVQNNFSWVILGILVLSMIPVTIEIVRQLILHKRKSHV